MAKRRHDRGSLRGFSGDPPGSPVFIRSAIASIDDRRQWYPAPFRPAAALPRAAARLVVAPSRRDPLVEALRRRVGFRSPERWVSSKVAFAVPERVALCAKRKIRREVFFAEKLFKRGGRGGSKRPRRRNEFSDVRC